MRYAATIGRLILARFAARLVELGARVIVESWPALLELFRTWPGFAGVIAIGKRPP